MTMERRARQVLNRSGSEGFEPLNRGLSSINCSGAPFAKPIMPVTRKVRGSACWEVVRLLMFVLLRDVILQRCLLPEIVSRVRVELQSSIRCQPPIEVRSMFLELQSGQ